MNKKQLSRAKAIWQDTKSLDTVAMYITGIEKTNFQGILELVGFINMYIINPLRFELANKNIEIKELKQKLQIKEVITNENSNSD